MRFAVKMLEMLTSAYNRTDLARLNEDKLPETNIGKLFYLAGWGFDQVWFQTKKMEQWNDIDLVSGEELNRLGANFRASRCGMNDEDYRIFIKATLMSRDCGNLDSLIHAAASLFHIQTDQIDVSESYPAKVCFLVYDSDLQSGYFERAGMIRKMIKKVAAAGIGIELKIEVYGFVLEDIRYKNRLIFRDCFYPQFNLPQLLLDGGWSLDGSQNLGGYDSQEQVDLYPVSVRFRTEAQETFREDTRMRLQTGAGSEAEFESQAVISVRSSAINGIESGQEITVRVSVAESLEEHTGIRLRESVEERAKSGGNILLALSAECGTTSGEQMRVRFSAAEVVQAGDIMVHNQSYMDGEWTLDGSRNLNGGTELR